jgi:ribonuclease BN (tRNA processing enzyme)
MSADKPDTKGISRRSVLKGAGALIAAPFLMGSMGGQAMAASSTVARSVQEAKNYNTQLVLLGTTGGMTWWPGSNRASASQALVVGDALYIIDLGFGATHRLAEAFNWGHFATVNGEKIQLEFSSFLSNLKGVFLTHLHMDHLGDYPTFLQIGARAGFGVPDPLPIIGPGDRGRMPENHSGYPGTIAMAACASPPTPTPGTRVMTDLILQAFAQNFNDCTHDVGYPDIPKIIDVREIGDPKTIPWPTSFTPPDPNKVWTRADTCPAMEPFEIYRDNRIKVTAVLVDHYAVYPSFAFRFDTEDGSLAISGDTGPDTQGNLQKLAKGVDVLVHEVIDDAWVDNAYKGVKEGDPAWTLYHHIITAHTLTRDVGRVAESCGAKTLVLSHIAPGNTPNSRLKKAQKGFSGKLVLGEDLMRVGVGRKGKGGKA